MELRRNVAIVQAGIVAAVAADELEGVGVATLRLAIDHEGWLAPQNHRQAMPGLGRGPHTCPFRCDRGGVAALKAAAPVMFGPALWCGTGTLLPFRDLLTIAPGPSYP
jgi:hypothetical protein